MASSRRMNRNLRKLVSHSLVLAIAAVALFDLWQSSCAMPTEESFSREISLSLTRLSYSEAELIGLVHSEMSKQIARLGSIDVVDVIFTSNCHRDACELRDATLNMRIVFYPLCTFKNGGSGQFASVWYKDYISAVWIQLSTVRTVSFETSWSPERISDIASVKEFALRSIAGDVWESHPELKLLINRQRGGWSFNIWSHLDSKDQFATGRLEDSDIQQSA